MDFYGASAQQLAEWAATQGLPALRGRQLFSAVQRLRNNPPASIRQYVAAISERPPGREVQRQQSSDGTMKSLLELHDGLRVECVSIPSATRHTVCVSSQVGCAVGCTFCASGINGVQRNLSAGEIVWQVLHFHRQRPVSNVVFMGSGEPLFNYANVIQAIRVLGDDWGLGLGRRRITVSTSGVPEKMRQLANDEPRVTLALSLHAPDDETRNRLVPINRRWPIATLLSTLDALCQQVNRRMTLEYVLLADANMQPTQAQELGAWGQRYNAHINLIPFNPVSLSVSHSAHQRPTDEQVQRFAEAVTFAGGYVTIRGQRGADIDAACGQLFLRSL